MQTRHVLPVVKLLKKKLIWGEAFIIAVDVKLSLLPNLLSLKILFSDNSQKTPM